MRRISDPNAQHNKRTGTHLRKGARRRREHVAQRLSVNQRHASLDGKVRGAPAVGARRRNKN